MHIDCDQLTLLPGSACLGNGDYGIDVDVPTLIATGVGARDTARGLNLLARVRANAHVARGVRLEGNGCQGVRVHNGGSVDLTGAVVRGNGLFGELVSESQRGMEVAVDGFDAPADTEDEGPPPPPFTAADITARCGLHARRLWERGSPYRRRTAPSLTAGWRELAAAAEGSLTTRNAARLRHFQSLTLCPHTLRSVPRSPRPLQSVSSSLLSVLRPPPAAHYHHVTAGSPSTESMWRAPSGWWRSARRTCSRPSRR